MIKITEIPEIRKRTRYKRDRQGILYRYTEEYYVFKQVPTINGKERIIHYITDGLFIFLITIPFFVGFIYLINSLRLSSIFEILIAFSMFFFIWLTIFFLYYVYWENKFQQTPGKKSTDSIVVDEYGKRPTLKKIIIRTLCRFVPFDLYSCFGDPSFGLHDEWSKTFVIKKNELQKLLDEIENLDNNN